MLYRRNVGLMVSIVFIMSSCKLADLRTKTILDGISDAERKKGKEVLMRAYHAHGAKNMLNHSTYSVTGYDHWKGLMGKMGQMWPDNNVKMRFDFALNSFDSRFQILEGKSKGYLAGLQSWVFYDNKEGSLIFYDQPSDRITFGLAAFHYFFEILNRLKDAPTLAYAGERNVSGINYDMVFVTWQNSQPTEDYDQYILYVNKQTGMLEYVSYTIRENYLPGARSLYGTIYFGDFRNVNDVKIPFDQRVFLNDINKNKEKYLHKLTVKEFEFDSIPLNTLYPNENLEYIGDAKPTTID